MKVLFLGSPRFSVEILKHLLSSKHEVVAVVTQPDRPSGRGHKMTPTLVKTFALHSGVQVFDFEKVCEHIEDIKKVDFDIAVTASFGQILRENFLQLAPCINVHPSLLPKYRGATPIQTALLNGDNETGVSIMKVVRAVDAGDVYAQKKLDINDDDNYTSLEQKLAKLGGEMLIEVLEKLEQENIKAWQQNENEATFCQKITKEDCVLDLSLTAKEIVQRSKAFSEIGLTLLIDDQRIKVGKVQDVSDKHGQLNQGQMLESKKDFVLGCKGGAVEIMTAQSKSGKYVSGRDFLNGFKKSN